VLDLHGAGALVTGGAGFIGSTLVDSLLRLGCTVVAFDNFDPFYTGKEGNVRHNLANPKFSLVRGSILDEKALAQAIKGADVVFHLAGQAGVRFCIENPLKAEEVNAMGTLDVLQAVRRAKTVKKVVYASSSSIFGNPVKQMLSEDHPQNPTSPYGVSKLAGEKYCLAFYQTYGTPVTCLRYFSVYGPRGRPDQVVYSFAKRVMNGDPPVIYGDGRQSRDFTFVTDIVGGTVLAAMADESVGQAFNLGFGKEFPIEAVARMVIDSFGADLEPKFEPAYKGDFPKTLCQNAKARSLLRWSPQVDLETGVAEFLEWFKATQGIIPADASPTQ
jgi:nucleoside-diphosphate-sugar epimerase